LLRENRFAEAAECFADCLKKPEAEERPEAHLGHAIADYRRSSLLRLAYQCALDIHRDYYRILEGRRPEDGYLQYHRARLCLSRGDIACADRGFRSAAEALSADTLYAAWSQVGIEICRFIQNPSSNPHHLQIPEVGRRMQGQIMAEVASYARAGLIPYPEIDSALRRQCEETSSIDPYLCAACGALIETDIVDGELTWLDLSAPRRKTSIRLESSLSREISYYDAEILALAAQALLRRALRHAEASIHLADESSDRIQQTARLLHVRALHALGQDEDLLHEEDGQAMVETLPYLASATQRYGNPDESRSLWTRIVNDAPPEVQWTAASLMSETGAFIDESHALIEQFIQEAQDQRKRLPPTLCEAAGRVALARQEYSDAEQWFRKARLGLSQAGEPSPLLVLRHVRAMYNKDRDGYRFILQDLRTLEKKYDALKQLGEPMEIVYADLIRDTGRPPIER
jgi:tetratricopeptide (TPR) repeat protein